MLRDLKRRDVLGTKRCYSTYTFHSLLQRSRNPQLWGPIAVHNSTWVSSGPGLQKRGLGHPLPAAPPVSMAALPRAGQGHVAARSRPRCLFGVIEDDDSVFCLSPRPAGIKGSMKEPLDRQEFTGKCHQLPKIGCSYGCYHQGLPGFPELLKRCISDSSATAGWREGRENPEGPHLPQLRLQHGLLAQRQAEGCLGRFSMQIGNRSPGKTCGQRNRP